MEVSDPPLEVVSGGSPASQGITRSPRRRVCRTCGQHHATHEPHVYDYVDEVDEDVTCHICLQPLVIPVDTPCGHTFCKPCLLAFLKVQQNCPIDRKPLSQQLCSFSSLVLKKLLEKLMVKCPNSEFCKITLARGDLEDHLKYRCPGNWVACSFSTAGCNFRGPQRNMPTHISTCGFKEQGVNRSPILEGEISFIEIPRTQNALGIAIVGGADTPLRCVVIQEVFPDGLIAHDGRLQAGDQIIEIEGSDMTNASHHQLCTALKRTSHVLRLGIYRERVEVYKISSASPTERSKDPSSPVNVPKTSQPTTASPINIDLQGLTEQENNPYGTTSSNAASKESLNNQDELVNVTLTREMGRKLGIKLGGKRSESGIFIMELMSGSVAEQDGRLYPNDRILAINGGDVRYARLDYAFHLIKQNQSHVSLIVSRNPYREQYDHLFKRPHPDLVVAHSRTKSAPDRLVEQNGNLNSQEIGNRSYDLKEGVENGGYDRSASCESLENRINRSGSVSRFHSNGSIPSHVKYSAANSLESFGDLERISQNKNSSLTSLTSGLNKSSRSLASPIGHFIAEEVEGNDGNPAPALPPRSRQPLNQTHAFEQLNDSDLSNENTREGPSEFESPDSGGKSVGSALPASGCADAAENSTPASKSKSRRSRDCSDLGDLALGMRKSLRIEGNQLHQKTVTISKDASESLGMRIGGGVSSNEGNIPIYIANIHPQGPVGKSKQVKKGDILLSVNGHSLFGLTHTQAVSLLKATAELAGVTLSLLEGSETNTGPANFVPSWLYWQRLPRALHISKSVILHRPPGASLGFSIVGGSDPERGPEPIHVLFVVSTSPAAVDGRLRCGDRLLAVDGRCLEAVSHATAVSLLKQAGQRVALEVVSWMGTEL